MKNQEYNHKSIGEQARDFRISLGFTQSDIARLSNYNETLISRFERGLSKSMYVLFEYMKLGFEPDFDPYRDKIDDGGLMDVIGVIHDYNKGD